MITCQFKTGDIVEIADKIDPVNQPTTVATIKYIEPDNEIPNLFWLYLIANEELLNTNMHPTFGYYWIIIENNSDYIRLISRATVS